MCNHSREFLKVISFRSPGNVTPTGSYGTNLLSPEPRWGCWPHQGLGGWGSQVGRTQLNSAKDWTVLPKLFSCWTFHLVGNWLFNVSDRLTHVSNMAMASARQHSDMDSFPHGTLSTSFQYPVPSLSAPSITSSSPLLNQLTFIKNKIKVVISWF